MSQINKIASILVALFLLLGSAEGRSIEELREKINKVLSNKSATVGLAINGANANDTLSINGNRHLPMQSVYKFHLAIAVLHQVDLGKLALDQKIILNKELIQSYENLWSPLKNKYPDGGELKLSELIECSVAWSDNLACDLLFELIGGCKNVEEYFHEIGIEEISIKHPEIVMQSDWAIQFENWTSPRAANQVLQLFYENKKDLLSSSNHDFLLEIMKSTKTGKNRIRGLLPENTVVAHKTGYSGKNKEGITAALNDIGIVFLPNGSHFYLSVLVSDSKESDETNQKIIAEVSRLAWDYFLEE